MGIVKSFIKVDSNLFAYDKSSKTIYVKDSYDYEALIKFIKGLKNNVKIHIEV